MPIITSLNQNDFLRDRLNVIGSHCFTPKLDTKIHIRKIFFLKMENYFHRLPHADKFRYFFLYNFFY